VNGPHAKGSGPAIGDHVTVTHEASGSVVHGTVRLRAGLGLVVDADGCVVELDREGWHCTQRDTEPPVGAVVVIDLKYKLGPLAAQRIGDGWYLAASDTERTWEQIRAFGPVELVWEPTQ
jgi:hypothetical protein